MLKSIIENYLNKYKGDFSVSIKNFNTEQYIHINENHIFPSASTIKLLILAELLRQESTNEININTLIRIKDYDIVLGDGILKEINSDITLSLLDLATLMIIVSDNYATNILIEILGFDNINNTAKLFNLNNTKLQRKMMDEDAISKGLENLTTSSDMLILLDLIYKNNLVNVEMSKLALNILSRQQVDGINSLIPNEIKLAHKTGNLHNLEHDIGIVLLNDNNYAISIFCNNLDNNQIGKEIIKNISKIVFDFYSNPIK